MIVFIIAGLYLGFFHPFAPELPSAGHWCIAGLLIAVGLWIFAPRWMPLSVGSVLMMMISLAAGLKYSAVFSGYTGTAIWILIPALFFGFALTKTGLGKRLAYRIIGIFRPTYLTLTISWLVIGLVLSALTPSITVRVAIIIPLAATTVEICNIAGHSKGASYIMLIAWAMAVIPGTGWLTGALWGPIGKGFFDATPALANVMTFESWGRAMLLPAELTALLFIIGLYLVMKPEHPLELKTDTFKAAYAGLGPMSFKEKATLVILSLAFIMFASGRAHHIPDAAVCLGAFALLAIFRIIEIKDIASGINWDLVLFLGSVFGLGAVFMDSGVSGVFDRDLLPCYCRPFDRPVAVHLSHGYSAFHLALCGCSSAQSHYTDDNTGLPIDCGKPRHQPHRVFLSGDYGRQLLFSLLPAAVYHSGGIAGRQGRMVARSAC
jgi:anion transporter